MEQMGDHTIMYPIQPDIALNTHDYQQKIILWNPLTKNQAVLFQFTVLEGQRKSFCILPDGCVELLFRCSLQNPRLTLFGKRTKSLQLELEPGHVYFGFRPFYEAGFQVSALDHLDIIDQAVVLEGIPEYENLIVALASATDFQQRCNVFVQGGLSSSFWDKSYRYNHVIACSRKICISGGTISIGSLGADMGYTNRHIRSSYKNVFGITPVFYKEIIRFQSSVHMLLSQSVHDKSEFTRISQDSGYCDQSYMIRSYNKFIHMTPKKFQEHLFA